MKKALPGRVYGHRRAGTALLYFVRTGDWLMASLFFVIGEIGFAGSLVFYDSLLPHIARPDEIDQVSSRGLRHGLPGRRHPAGDQPGDDHAGPSRPDRPDDPPDLPDRGFVVVRLQHPAAAFVSEPPTALCRVKRVKTRCWSASARLGSTFRDIRRYRNLFIFLVAFWFYNDGIGTIIKMATIYGAEIGIGQTALIGTLLMVQFVGIPFCLPVWLAGKENRHQALHLPGLLVYTIITIIGYFMTQEWHFWALGFAVATVQGGSQALSRSLFGRLAPKSKSAEFFGFFSVSEKFAGIMGPFIFGVVGQIMGNSRLAIISLIIFFVIGAALLSAGLMLMY
jgi:MFS transporter, UMF1 family